MAKRFRSISEEQEHGARDIARDTRPLGTRIYDFLSNPINAVVLLGTGAVSVFVSPASTDLVFIFGFGLYTFVMLQNYTLPFKLPKVSGQEDYNDTIPGTNKPKKAGGIAFFGNEIGTNKELWFSNDDMRTHVLIFGSTGSGKTEALVSLAYNSLIQGSGFIYIDGKGDNSLFAKVFSMVRRMGREDDLLLINFMTGARDIIGAQATRLSNTMNPFSIGSSSMLSQLVVSLMDSGKGGGSDSDMWKGRAISFVEALMKMLVAMRDEGQILLDANVIRNYFKLERLEQIVLDKKFPLDDNRTVPLDGVPSVVIEPLKNYVDNLPGFNPAKKFNQAGEVREQHGFITMQLTRVFSSLADAYGHIIRTNLAEVDFKDVVLNRRILVVLLPALEKSPDELANLGKIIVASLKAMMASGLGDEVEGSYQDVITRKPTNSPTPYLCVMDEYGYYAVPGFAVVPAQARSLGFSAVFAGQDLPAFQRASKEEAASIGANTNIKICMKLEDPTETWEFFNKTAGESYVTNVSSFQINSDSMTNNYLDTKSASIDRRARLDLLDLKDQREGDAHILYRSKIIRARMFYANPPPVKRLQLNQMLCVERPTDETLINLDQRLRRFSQIFNAPAFRMQAPPVNQEIKTIQDTLAHYDALKPFERGISAVIALLEQEAGKQKEFKAKQLEEDQKVEYADEINAFTSVYLPELSKTFIPEGEWRTFVNPMVMRNRTMEAMVHIERLSGFLAEDAQERARNLVGDIVKATQYPPQVQFEPDVEGLATVIKEFTKLYGSSTTGGQDNQ